MERGQYPKILPKVAAKCYHGSIVHRPHNKITPPASAFPELGPFFQAGDVFA
jgi:hypothetical protein